MPILFFLFLWISLGLCTNSPIVRLSWTILPRTPRSDRASLWHFQLGLGWRTHRSEFSASSFFLVLFPFSFFFYILYLFSVGFSLISFFVWSMSPSSPFLRFFFSLFVFKFLFYCCHYIFFFINFVSFLKSASVSPRGRPHCTSFVTLGAAAAQR